MTHFFYSYAPQKNKISGVALLLSVGILLLLVVLSFLFFQISRVETTVSQNWFYQVESRFLAESALDQAWISLSKALQKNPFLTPSNNSLLYPGEDTNRNGFLDPGEDLNHNGVLDISECPLRTCPTSSLANPLLPVTIQGIQHQVALEFPAPAGLRFIAKTKIIDESSKINLLNPHPSLQALLENLQQVLPSSNVHFSPDFPPSKNSHPPLSTLLQNFPPEIRNFLTTTSWLDPTVIQPHPASLQLQNTPITSLTQLVPKNLSLEPRAPVNINTAPYEVLVSVLSGLSALFMQKNSSLSERTPPNPFNPGNSQAYYGFSYPPTDFSSSSSRDLPMWRSISLSREKAQQVAQAILRQRIQKPFTSWEEIRTFLALPSLSLSPEEQAMIDAQANPNTQLNKENPDSLMYKEVDKTDLTRYTTEFSLFPTGVFTVETLGWVVVPSSGHILSETHVVSTVQLYTIDRWTTTKDFPSVGIDPKGAFQIFPFVPPSGEMSSAQNTLSPTDGYLELQPQPLSNHFTSDLTLLATYASHTADADFARGDPRAEQPPDNTTPRPSSLFSSSKDSFQFYPDGVYLDSTHALSYATDQNIPFDEEDLAPHFQILRQNFSQAFSSDTSPPSLFQSLSEQYGKKIAVSRGTISLWIKPAQNFFRTDHVQSLFKIIAPDDPQEKSPGPYRLFNLYFYPRSYLPMDPAQVVDYYSPSAITGRFLYSSWGELTFGPDVYAATEDQLPEGNPFHAGQWTHLALVWDSTGFVDFSSRLGQVSFRHGSESSLDGLSTLFDAFKGYTEKIRLYLNGQRVSKSLSNLFLKESPVSGTDQDLFRHRRFVLGSLSTESLWNAPFEGTLGEVAIFHRPLTDSEVFSLYHSRTAYPQVTLRFSLPLTSSPKKKPPLSIMVIPTWYGLNPTATAFSIEKLEGFSQTSVAHSSVNPSYALFSTWENPSSQPSQTKEYPKYISFQIRFRTRQTLFPNSFPILDELTFLAFYRPFLQSYYQE